MFISGIMTMVLSKFQTLMAHFPMESQSQMMRRIFLLIMFLITEPQG